MAAAPRGCRPSPAGAIVEPVPRPLAARLRRAVLEHAVSEHRRSFPPVLHIGDPGGRTARFVHEPTEPLDHALRTDVVEAMLRAAGQTASSGPTAPLLWLTRRRTDDPLEVHEADVQWAAAVRAAGAELGRPLGFVVVTRRGWRDPVTGVGRSWKRVRDR